MKDRPAIPPCQAPPTREELLDALVFAGRKLRDSLNCLIESCTDAAGEYGTEADRKYCETEAAELARIVAILARAGRRLD